jgi:hypothetical protein
MSMLEAAQLTARATVALAILAFVAAVVAGCAWWVQARQLRELRKVNAKQLPVLEGQRDELEASRLLRERGEQERHERFVSQVFSWHEIGPDHRLAQAQTAAGAKPSMVSRTFIRNTAPVPVYDLGFGWWIGDRLDFWSRRGTPLMPASYAAPAEATESWSWTIPDGVDHETIKVAVFIRDAAGNLWRIRPGGHYEPYTDDMLPPGQWKIT